MTDAKLLPCPFCGATPHRGLGKVWHDSLHGDRHQDHVIKCPHLCVTMTGSAEGVVEKWNRRTPHPAPVIAREAEPVAWAAYDDSLPVDVDLRQDIADQWCADGIEVRPLYAHPPQPSETVAEAAEIERLTKAHDTVCGALAEAISRAEKAEAENQRLREALKPFAAIADLFDSEVEGHSDTDELSLFYGDGANWLADRFTLAQFNAARAALSSGEASHD